MKSFLSIKSLAIVLLVFPFSYSDPPKAANNPERLNLLENALSWLTLRKDGKLIEPNLKGHLVKYLHDQYNSSLYFRTIVIAFQLGVLPKLTLQQGQPCVPAYTLRYRNKMNNSVTWLRVKNFTLESYYDLRRPGSQKDSYCNYTKGLVCLQTTKTCECPEGSKMEPIEPNSQDQRCLIEEDEFCAMPDVAAYKNIGAFVVKLPELIFNLEKPLSCKHGTTCRVQGSPFTRCLSTSKAPFQDDPPRAKYGEECLLDYLGEGGGCDVTTWFRYNSTSCFNFLAYIQNKRSLLSSGNKRTGFCAFEFAPFVTPGVISNGQTTGDPTMDIYYPFLNAFVNPGTVEMSSSQLLDYDKKLHEVTVTYNEDGKQSCSYCGQKSRIQRDVGEPCSVSATQKLIDIYNFFAGLEKKPTQGDFVADFPTLQAKLIEYTNLIENHTDYEPRICRIYLDKADWGDGETPPLTCVSTGTGPDATGNDGTCQISNSKDTYALALDVHNFRKEDFRSKDEIQNKDKYHNRAILKDNPEAWCIPSPSQRHRRSRNFNGDLEIIVEDERHVHGDVLEGGSCNEGFECIEDLSDSHGIYKNPKDKQDCSFVKNDQPLYHCLDVASDDLYIKHDTCEEELLDKRVMDAIQTAPRLPMGARCSYKLDQEIKKFFSSSRWWTNRYRMLLTLKTTGICDQTKLLECNEDNICGCKKWESEPRTTADKKYTSDYCYKTSGECRRTISGEYFIISLTAAEKKEMDLHYGKSSSISWKCEKGNVCKFIDACTKECTDINTGSTGYDVDIIGGCAPITTTTTTTEETKEIYITRPPRPLEPAEPYNSATLCVHKQSHLEVVTIVSIILIKLLI